LTRSLASEYFFTFPFAEIRSDDGTSSLKICTYSYAYPDADNEYDADWHRNFLLCTLPSFRAEIDEVILDGHTLNHYLGQLREFVDLKRSIVEFEPTEPYFDLNFSLDSRKKVLVKGVVQYPVGWGAELSFEFETDLSHVEHFISGIESILREFPAKR
jgi:hypothetical protein